MELAPFEISGEGDLRSIRGSSADRETLLLSFVRTDSATLDWPLDANSAQQLLDVAQTVLDGACIKADDDLEYGQMTIIMDHSPDSPVLITIKTHFDVDHPDFSAEASTGPGHWRKLIDNLKVFLGSPYALQVDRFYDELNHLI